MASVPVFVPRLNFRDHPKWSWVAAYFLTGWLASFYEYAMWETWSLNRFGYYFYSSLAVLFWPVGIWFAPWTFAASLTAAVVLVVYSVQIGGREADSRLRYWVDDWRRRAGDNAGLKAKLDEAEGRARAAELKCSGAQSKCGGRAIKGGFRRKLAETIGHVRRTLFETERTIDETDARSSVPTQNA